MAYERKNGDATIFKNDRKVNEKAPDFKGDFLAHRDIKAGEKIDVALWTRVSKSGNKFMSGFVGDPFKPGSKGTFKRARPDDDDF